MHFQSYKGAWGAHKQHVPTLNPKHVQTLKPDSGKPLVPAIPVAQIESVVVSVLPDPLPVGMPTKSVETASVAETTHVESRRGGRFTTWVETPLVLSPLIVLGFAFVGFVLLSWGWSWKAEVQRLSKQQSELMVAVLQSFRAPSV